MKNSRKMKMLSVFTAAAMVVGTMPAAVTMAGTEGGIQLLATATVDYVDADGNEQDPVTATELTDSDTTWDAGWYVADSDITISSRVTVNGEVNLILADGFTLTASAGITVDGENSLTIYGQTEESGTLEADNSGNNLSAIGGINGNNAGTITINGGKVNAVSTGTYGAGIGGGNNGSGGSITINGGTVTAQSGNRGAGIGGGNTADGGDITINGGTVNAQTSGSGAGIGGGQSSSGGNITITGGAVEALSGGEGAAIGGGTDNNKVGYDGGVITITGGNITINKAGGEGAGIGGGRYEAGGTIEISGGEVNIDEGMNGAGIGGGQSGAGGIITITGGFVSVVHEENGNGAGIGGGANADGGDITISGGTVFAKGDEFGAGIGDGANGHNGTFSTGEGNAFIAASDISDDADKSDWGGAIIIGSEGQVYGTPTLTTDAEIPSGDSLLIPDQTSLTIGADTTLTNSGTVYQNWGSTFNKNGSYADEGVTYYEILNLIENSALDGATEYSDTFYSEADNTITASLLDGGVLLGLTLTKNDGSTEEITGASFDMPDQPVQLEGAETTVVEIPAEDTNTYTYDGSEQTYVLETSEYYTIDGNVQTNAGTYTVTVSLNDPTTTVWEDGTTEDKLYTFVINKAVYDMSGVSFSDKTYTYDGEEHSIKIEIEDGGSLPAGVTVSYTDNTRTEVGEQTAVVHFTSDDENYEPIDDMTATLTILEAEFGAGSITATGYSGTYDGQEHAITVELSGQAEGAEVLYSTEESGTYTTECPSYTDVGEYTVYYKVSKENYDDVIGSLTIHITAKTITQDLFQVDTASEIYNGSEIVKEITAADMEAGNDPMQEGTDYEVTYSNNSNAGTAVITISGMGNYAGTLEYHFVIEKAAQEISYDETALTKLETAHSFTNPLNETVVSTEEGGGVTYTSSDESVAIVNAENGEVNIDGSGTASITATAAETENFAEATAAYTLTVVTPEETITSDLSDYTYTGEDIHLYANITHDTKDPEAEGLVYSYQWYRNDEAIEGATDEILTLRGADVGAQVGTVYTCVVTIQDEFLTDTLTASYTVTIIQADNSLTILTESLDKDYDGTAVAEPEIMADFGEDTVVFTWYKVDGNTTEELESAPVDAGNYKVVASIPETDNYKGASAELTFTIQAGAITGDMFEVNVDDETYTGSAITKEILSNLKEDVDYSVSYSNNINAGQATITITGIGDLSGTLEYTFTINKAVYDMSGISFPDMTYTYDGEEHAVKIEIEDGGSLPAGVTVSYTNNTRTEVGSQTATVSFTGDEENYEPIADMTATLTIVNAGFDDVFITAAGYNGIYDGQPHSVTVTISGETEGVEVTYSTEESGEYTENPPTFTDVGEYTVYYKISKANYKDVTGSLTVNIAAKEILESQFTVDTEPETYTGSEITKEIVSDLEEGTDYTVSYANNINAGEAVITIKGIGNYTGDLIYSFTIEEASFSDGAITSTGYTGTYDGNAHSITVELSGDAQGADITYSTEKNGDYTEENPSYTAVGIYTVYYKVSKESYFEVTGSETVVINGIDIAKEAAASLTSTNMTYNGSKQTAKIVVTATDGTVLTEGVDYVLEGQTEKSAGTHKATVTGTGNYTGSITVSYKIAKAAQSLKVKVKKSGKKKYTIKASKLENASSSFKLKVTKKGSMKVRYSTSTSKIKVSKKGKVTLKKGLKAGTYKIKVTTGATKNYKATKNPKVITVKVK